MEPNVLLGDVQLPPLFRCSAIEWKKEPTNAADITYVIGHQNPDADSICSAIAYTELKKAGGERGHVAARCGNSNSRIDMILSRFGQPLPMILSDVWPRVRDLMASEPFTVSEESTCAEALELIDRHGIRLLPVIDLNRRVKGTVSLSHLGGVLIPRMSEPKLMRQVQSTIGNIARALKAEVVHVVEEARPQEFFVRLGTMDIRSFWKISERDGISPASSLIIVGDRKDVQLRAIELGLRGIIVSGGVAVDADVIEMARTNDVSIIISPYDSATTAIIVRTASRIGQVIDPNFESVSRDARISEVRRKIATHHAPAFIVLDENERLAGILSKSDILRPIRTKLILVDHNEMSQAVNGADEVNITEIIDHHRLGMLSTQVPIRFINEPVGSTCTIVAEMFRRSNLQPSPELAGIMMSGLISDTLHLNSPTTTSRDTDILAWLSKIAGEDPRVLAEAIFSSGSVIQTSAPEAILRTDQKIYKEEGIRFSISQVEELGFASFWNSAKTLAISLQELVLKEKFAFAALLITDVNTKNSLLLIKGNHEIIERISFPPVGKDEIFDLPGIVSRKKQLVPYLTSLLKDRRT
jgi:manganese-dependent inorganic pyrophosphatase